MTSTSRITDLLRGRLVGRLSLPLEGSAESNARTTAADVVAFDNAWSAADPRIVTPDPTTWPPSAQNGSRPPRTTRGGELILSSNEAGPCALGLSLMFPGNDRLDEAVARTAQEVLAGSADGLVTGALRSSGIAYTIRSALEVASWGMVFTLCFEAEPRHVATALLSITGAIEALSRTSNEDLDRARDAASGKLALERGTARGAIQATLAELDRGGEGTLAGHQFEFAKLPRRLFHERARSLLTTGNVSLAIAAPKQLLRLQNLQLHSVVTRAGFTVRTTPEEE